jgi:serine/threonine-protein kinase
MLQQGKLLNQRYEILELVGGGGMSLIYRAMDIERHRTVAIKVLREQYSEDPVFIARFNREGQSVSGLDHPNIVKIYGVGKDEGVHYLIMEMIEGRDLKQVLQEKGFFTPRELYPIAAQICDAIAYAHHKKIIHRDIKPHNIIVRPDGQIKVTDFGIARAASEATMTHTGSIMGSVHYLSPEQAKGEIADERSDIYSLGVLLYEMATGRLPHEGESPISVAVQKIQKDPVPPRTANPELNEAMELVILRAMNRDPRKRYPSALELKDDLREACFNNRVMFEPAPDVMQDTLQGDDLARLSEFAGSSAAIQEGDRYRTGGGLGGKTPKRPWWHLLLFFLGLTAAGLIIGLGVSSILYEPEDVIVPDVTRMPYQEALDTLAAANLQGILSEEKALHTSVAKDAIAFQEPAGNVPVKAGSTILLTISAGPEQVIVPELRGLSAQAAEVELANKKLKLGNTTEVNDNEVPKGGVIRQDPAAGSSVDLESVVSIIISKGPVIQYVKVQSFVGMPLGEAQAAAAALGITIGSIEKEMSWTYAEGMVVRQDPVGDAEVEAGTPVNLVVSSGPGPAQ